MGFKKKTTAQIEEQIAQEQEANKKKGDTKEITIGETEAKEETPLIQAISQMTDLEYRTELLGCTYEILNRLRIAEGEKKL